MSGQMKFNIFPMALLLFLFLFVLAFISLLFFTVSEFHKCNPVTTDTPPCPSLAPIKTKSKGEVDRHGRNMRILHETTTMHPIIVCCWSLSEKQRLSCSTSVLGGTPDSEKLT